MGDPAGGRRFPLKMYGMWPSGHDRAENGGEKCPWAHQSGGERNALADKACRRTRKIAKKLAEITKKLTESAKKCLLLYGKSAKIFIRDTLKSLLLKLKSRARDHKEVKQ